MKRLLIKSSLILLLVVTALANIFSYRLSYVNYLSGEYYHSFVGINEEAALTALAAYAQTNPQQRFLAFDPQWSAEKQNNYTITFYRYLTEFSRLRLSNEDIAWEVYLDDNLLAQSPNRHWRKEFIGKELVRSGTNFQITDEFIIGSQKISDVILFDALFHKVNKYDKTFKQRLIPTEPQVDLRNDTPKLNLPTGLRIVFHLPYTLPIDNELYISLLAGSYPLTNLLLYFALITLIFALAVFFIADKYLVNLAICRIFTHFHAESYCLLALPLTLVTAMILLITGEYTVNGEVAYLFGNLGLIHYGLLLKTLLFCAYFLWYALLMADIYYFKQYFREGFWTTLKAKSLFAAMFRALKTSLYRALSLDFSDKSLFQIIALAFVLYFLVIFIPVTVLRERLDLALIFATFFYVSCILAILHEYNRFKKDYETLLGRIEKMSIKDFRALEATPTRFQDLEAALRQVEVTLDEAIAEEKKSQRLKTELITNVSHDLKTPITGMRSYLELLENEKLNAAERAEYLKVITGYNNRLNRLVDDLFAIAKVNSGEYKLELIDLDVNTLIKQALIECEERLAEKGLKTFFKADAEKINLKLDADKTFRIFENLLTNISKYALANTHVYIDIQHDETKTEIVFKNILAEALDIPAAKLTERFTRGDKSRHQSGSGLGLAIVNSFCEIQNGKFTPEIDGDVFKAHVVFYHR